MKNCMAIVLAAGDSTRMRSKTSKVMHNICGKPIVEWVFSSIQEANIKNTVVVVGKYPNEISDYLKDTAKYVVQQQKLGTAHAVMQAKKYFENFDGDVVVLCGDTPIVTAETICSMLELHQSCNNDATLISANVSNPHGYGRIIRNTSGEVLKIVEERDCSGGERIINEVNAGMYCFSSKALIETLDSIDNTNNQNEYYLTDVIQKLVSQHKKVSVFRVNDPSEILGINDRVQLAEATNILRIRIMREHMLSGVTILDPQSTFIDCNTKIDMDTTIYPGTIIEGICLIGSNCIIGPNVKIVNCIIHDEVQINNSVLLESSVNIRTTIGPFAYIRPGTKIGEDVKIGDFVEIKKSAVGNKTKISHLTYVGDCEIGDGVNLGCGVVVVNYDGVKKNKCVIKDNAFVGCNTNLISPVEVGENSYIAAGSTITHNVPAETLAIARSRQIIKVNWKKIRSKMKKSSGE